MYLVFPPTSNRVKHQMIPDMTTDLIFSPHQSLACLFIFKWMRMKWQKKRFFQSIKSNQRGRLFDGQSGGTTAQRYIYYKTSSGDNVMN